MEKRRIIPAFFVLSVIFAIVLHPCVAAAGMSGLEVTGQTAMTQQIFTDLSVIGADSCGLTDAINGTKNPAQTIGEWIKGYWDSWLLRQQLTWGTVLNIAAAGARYTGNGDLLFNSQLSDLFTRFYNWLWDGEDGPHILDNAEVLPGQPSTEGTITNENVPSEVLYYPSYSYNLNYSSTITENRKNGDKIVYSGAEFFVLFSNNQGFAFSSVPFTLVTTVNGRVSNTYNVTTPYTTKTGNNYRYYGVGIASSAYVQSFSPSYSYIRNGSSVVTNFNDAIGSDIFTILSGYTIGDDQILGDPDKLGGLTGADTNVVAPPDIINWPDFGGNGGYIDVNDYITGVRGAIESEDGTADVNITDSEGVESTQTMEIDQTTDIPVESETTAEMVNQGEVISTATPSTELADYTIDLRNYFPFCIPWDLYDMVTILVADPVAPHVQYPFVIEPLNINYTIDLDFSQFDSVAAVLRTMELLAAGIGLALMTKRLIQGGD